MRRRFGIILILCLMITPITARAQDNSISLAVDPVLNDSGLMQFLLPRFSLKTGISIELAPLASGDELPDGVNVVIGIHPLPGSVAGQPVVHGLDLTFSVASTRGNNGDPVPAQNAARFIDWLHGEVGKRTIEQFQIDGVQVFTAADGPAIAKAQVTFDGNENSGETLAYRVCGRCHVIGARNRMKGLGSTPSFALMRTFQDWRIRFEAFFTLNPHPSFTQITDVTTPFDATLPPPISPVILTLEQLDDIVAFVATIEPANLGAPIVHQ